MNFDFGLNPSVLTKNGWTEVLRFTSNANVDMNAHGTRIPAVFLNKGFFTGYMGIRTQLGENHNYGKNVNVEKYTWYIVQLKQYQEEGKVIFN